MNATVNLTDLLHTAADLTNDIEDLGHEIAMVNVWNSSSSVVDQLRFQLRGPHHPSSLVGLLVDLDCVDIVEDSTLHTVGARGTLPSGVLVYAAVTG